MARCLRSAAGWRGVAAVPVVLPLVLLLAATGATGVPALEAQERPVIVIDPGHGGAEAGVVQGDLVEKDLVLRIGFSIAERLVAAGYDVRLTRSGDHAVPWEERRAIAEEAGGALLLMLHLNASDDPSRHGAEIYAHLENDASARAAAALAEVLEEAGSAVVVEPRPWPFLQSPTVPTLMVELAFLTHPVERRLVLSDAYPRDVGEIVVTATRRILEGGRR